MSNEKDKTHEHDYVTACFDCGHIAGRAEVEALRREAREEALKDAITKLCLDCAEGDLPAYDAKARWYYHGEGRHEVGCSASKLRMLEAAATTQKGENDGCAKRQ